MKSLLQYAAKSFADAVYPPRCIACDGFLPPIPKACKAKSFPAAGAATDLSRREFARIMRPVLCPECSADFTPVTSPLCEICGAVFTARQGIDHVCRECWKSPGAFDSARAVGLYQGPLMAAIHKLKYNHCLALVKPLSTMLFRRFLQWHRLFAIDLVLPVPLHRRKLRERGFNQSGLLLRPWRRLVVENDKNGAGPQVRTDILVRTRNTRSQTRLSKKERRENVKGAFSLLVPEAVSGKRILVVDDVYTTGATVGECAEVLKAGGASRVDILTVARVG